MWLLLHPEFTSTIHRSRLRNNHRYVPQKITRFSPFSSFPQTQMSIELTFVFATVKFHIGLNKWADTAENRLVLPLFAVFSLCSPLRPAGISADTIPSLQDGTDTHISLPGQTLVSVDFLSVTRLLAFFVFANRIFSSAISGRKHFSDNYSHSVIILNSRARPRISACAYFPFFFFLPRMHTKTACVCPD